MIPPTESSRFVAVEFVKGSKNLEEIGAKFLGPNCFRVVVFKWWNAYVHFHGFGKYGHLEANLETFKTALIRESHGKLHRKMTTHI